MKKILMLILMFVCSVTTSVFAADFKNYLEKIETLKKQGISYNVSSVNGKEKVNATIYMKGDKIKIDAAEGITILDGKNVYVYMEQEKTAMKMNIDKETVKQNTFDIIQDKADELKFIEKGTKNGYACQVFKSKVEGQNTVYYLTDDYGFPTYIKEGKNETNITNFKVGKVSDNIFVLPKDVNVIDMANFSMEDMVKSMQ